MMTPALIESLQDTARRMAEAGHGGRQAIAASAAQDMGISLPTLYRQLKQVITTPERKKRSDAGALTLTLDEAKVISGYLIETQRNNGKRLATIEDSLDVLRSNGVINAGRLDAATGEWMPLSASAISRALRSYHLHPDQLARPSPKVHMASRHPNHVWQIDPSLCVLFYLPARKGMQVMSEKEFYKNKPNNVQRIEKERVWRYVITDHASGVVFVHYVLGAESGKNLVDAFVRATQKRPEDPFHGVPFMAMLDPGSANTGAVFSNLCRALGVEVQINRPGQPWAKGQVEQANNAVERHFEHRLPFMAPVQSVEQLNALATTWMRTFNEFRVHTRTATTRYGAWLRIKPDELRIAPPAQLMKELATEALETRKVSSFLTVQFNGQEYDVSTIPVAEVGEKLTVTRNPWREGSMQVVYSDAGRDVIAVIEPVKVGEYGFPETAVPIGEHRRHADTALDKNRKAVEQLVMDAANDTDAEEKRKAKALPFGGRIDPMKPITGAKRPTHLPRSGTALPMSTLSIEIKPLTHVEAGKILSARLGSTWNSDHYAWLRQQYPDGIQEEQLDHIEQQLRAEPAPLRLIN